MDGAGGDARRDRPRIYRQLQGVGAEHVERRLQHRRRHDAQPGLRRVVRGEGAGGARRRGVGALERLAGGVFDPLRRQDARPQQHRPAGRAVDDRRLDADRAAPPSSTASSAPNSSATCAAVVALTRPKRFALGAAMPKTSSPAALTSSAWATGCAGQRRPIVACPAAAAVGDAGATRDDDGERPRPEGVDEALGDARQRGGEAVGAGAIGDVDDQRMRRRTALEREDRATAASLSARAPRP
jgi:hypothetical protein